jgi:ubiquinone biosynthesis protein
MELFSSLRSRYRSFLRYNQIIRVFVKYGFEELVANMISSGRYRFIRRLIPTTTKKNAQKYTKWEKMRLVCEELGPTFIKFAQILSNRPDIIPDELILQFEKLQDNVPPLPGETAKQVVEKELSDKIEDLFAWFELEAFASASIAQVHKATLKTGERIVMKIQRPGIRKIIVEDIKVMYTLADIIERRVPTMRNFDPKGLVKNFEESILKELDFIHESVNILRFTNNILHDAEDKTTYTLKIYKPFTTRKVLAIEYVEGIKITDKSQLEAKGYDCEKIARRLAVSYTKQVFQYGFFHADPHPGNLLIMPNEEVCFLDFGMMGSILPRDVEMFAQLFISVKTDDIKGVIRALQQMSDTSNIRDLRALEFAINEFIQSYSVSTYHQNEMSTILMELKDVIVLHGLRVPPHFFLLARSMVTIEGVIHHLDPKLDILELARPYIARAMRKELNPFKLARKMLNGLYDLGVYMEDFPLDLKNAIRRINNGKIMVDLTHKGIDPVVHTINRVTRQLIMSLIFSGLTTGAILFIRFDVGPHWWGTSSFGLISIVLALYVGNRILRDVRKGDHDDWKGWDEE